MSKITNNPKTKNKLIKRIRELLEHRAIWLAVLTQEAAKKGLTIEQYAPDAVFRCGCIQGAELSGGSKSFKTLKKKLFGFFAQKVFDMKIVECGDDLLSIDFHYCPLVAAWQKMGCSDEEIAVLCDTAMCGDRGIASCFGGELHLDKVIAKGDPFCEIRFVKKTEQIKDAESTVPAQEK